MEGKGNLEVAFSVLKKLGIENIPIVGLAKRLEEVFIPVLSTLNQLVRIVLDLSYSEELEMKLIDLQLIIRSKKGIQIYLSHHLNLYTRFRKETLFFKCIIELFREYKDYFPAYSRGNKLEKLRFL